MHRPELEALANDTCDGLEIQEPRSDMRNIMHTPARNTLPRVLKRGELALYCKKRYIS